MNVRHAVMLPALAAVMLAPALARSGPWIPMPGEFSSELSASHSATSGIFDDQGDRVPNGYHTLVESRALMSTNEIGWKKRMSLVLAVPATSVTLRSDIPSLNGSRTGLGDLILGFRLKLLDGPSGLAFEGDWKAPLGYDREATPALGEGQQDVSGTLHFGTTIPRLDGFLQLSWGYMYRFESPLDRMMHGADLAFWLGPSFLLAGHYQGSTYVSSRGPGLEYDTYAAGPELRYRVDDRMDVFAGSSHTFAGRNASRNNDYYVGLAVKHTRLNRLQGFLGNTRRP